MTMKWILVEGSWGAGKTTTATFIQNVLEQRKIQARLFTEGSPNHPVDPDHVAFFSQTEYDELQESFPDQSELIRNRTSKVGSHYAVSYIEWKNLIPETLWVRLRSHDIYNGDLSIEEHCTAVLELWNAFAEDQTEKEEVIVLECCFLQNPVTTLLARYAAEENQIAEHIRDISRTLRKGKPTVFYLQHESIKATFDRAIQERSKEWLEKVADYCLGQGYAQKHSLHGVRGLGEFLQEREKIELEILRHLDFPVKYITIKGDDKEQSQKEIKAYLEECVL